MDDQYGSPPEASIRGARPQGFLPLNTDDGLSTRGQTLGALIRSQSRVSFRDVAFSIVNQRRSIGSRDEETDGDSASINPASWTERKMSNGPQALMGLQMRSMRLIGQSNPRYQWQAG